MNGSPCFVRHPAREWVIASPEYAIPVRLWGDDAEQSREHSFMALHWCSCVSEAAPDDAKQTIGVFVMRDMTPDSLEEFYAPTVANVHAALGPQPDVDPEGRPWRGGKRVPTGTPYAGPYRLVYIETSGDWKWKKEAHRLPWHYNMRVHGVCHECQATGAEGDMSYKDFSDNAPHLVTCRTHQEYLSHFLPRPPPVLATLPGFDVTASLVGDWQHEVCLGIAQVAAGSCFADMLDTNLWEAPPGRWKENYSVQLRIATAQFKKWCKQRGIVTSRPAFTVNRLNLGNAKSDEPLFKKQSRELHGCGPMVGRCRQGGLGSPSHWQESNDNHVGACRHMVCFANQPLMAYYGTTGTLETFWAYLPSEMCRSVHSSTICAEQEMAA